MKLKNLIIGDIYSVTDITGTYFAAYCGISTLNLPMVELIDEPIGIDGDHYKPTNWNPIGTNTYWCFQGIEKYMSIPQYKIRNDKLKKLGINDE